MLYIVLLLVLAALGLLVAALITSESLFAWISIGLSIAAAVALFVDWLSRRRAERRAAAAPEEAAEAGHLDDELPAETAAEGAEEPAAGHLVDEVPAGEAAEGPEVSEAPADLESVTAVVEPVELATAVVEPAEPAEPAEEPVEDDSLPDEEETDAADLLIVCELDDQVIVVDEHPRYHLEQCRWLGEKDTIPIAVSEARELGFTPCARCGPDAKLAEQARRKRRAGAS